MGLRCSQHDPGCSDPVRVSDADSSLFSSGDACLLTSCAVTQRSLETHAASMRSRFAAGGRLSVDGSYPRSTRAAGSMTVGPRFTHESFNVERTTLNADGHSVRCPFSVRSAAVSFRGDDQGRNRPVGTDSHSVRSVGCKQRREKNRPSDPDDSRPSPFEPRLSSLTTLYPNGVKFIPGRCHLPSPFVQVGCWDAGICSILQSGCPFWLDPKWTKRSRPRGMTRKGPL